MASRTVILMLGVFVAFRLDVAIADPPAQRPATASEVDRFQLLIERNRLLKELTEAESKGKADTAIALAEKVLAVERRSFGDASDEVVASLNRLARYRAALGDYVGAGRSYSEKLSTVSKLYGANDWRAVDCRLAVRDMEINAHLTPEQLHSLIETYRQTFQISELAQKGDVGKAIELAAKVLETRRRLLGVEHSDAVDSLNWLASLQISNGDRKQALALYRRLAEIQKATLGEMHPQYAITLANVAQASRLMGAYAIAEPLYRQSLEIRRKTMGESDTEYALILHALSGLCNAQGKYKEDLRLAQQAVEIEKKTLGERHPSYATGLDSLALAYAGLMDFTRAETLHRQALEIRKSALGEENSAYAQSLHNLAALYSAQWDFKRAEPLEQQALAIKKKLLNSRRSPAIAVSYAETLDSLAILYHRQGQSERAERLFEEAQSIRGIFLGKEHPDYAFSLSNLGEHYRSQGDELRAERLIWQAAEIRKKALGENHPEYAASLEALANVFTSRGDFAHAEPLCRQALQINIIALGESHPTVARSLNNLAGVYEARADYVQAEPLLRRALEIRRLTLGETNPDYGLSLISLGALCDMKGDFASAQRLYSQAMQIEKKAVGEDHLYYAICSLALGASYRTQGDIQKAEPLSRRGLEVIERRFADSLWGQSERRQLALAKKLRLALEDYISCSKQGPLGGADTSGAYRHLLGWKGAVFLRQFTTRRARNHPELKPIVDKLQDINVRLSTLALQGPPPNAREEWQGQISELTEAKEQHEKNLSRRSAEFRQDQALLTLQPAQLQQTLPPNAVLVDFLEYSDVDMRTASKSPTRRDRSLVAFIVRRDRPIARIDFGPIQSLADAAAAWRKDIVAGKGYSTAAAEDEKIAPQQTLSSRLWGPLEGHLKGADLVLISPDGFLNSIPWGALPVRADATNSGGRYLVEEKQIALVPVPRMLPLLMSEKPSSDNSLADSSLLVMGDIDFGSSPSAASGSQPFALANDERRSAARSSSSAAVFSALPGTAQEAASIGTLYATLFGKKADVLEGGAATEEAFRSQAPKHRYLHVATHGFFADPGIRSASDRSQQAFTRDSYGFGLETKEDAEGLHPGLLSGIALAGANRGGHAELKSSMVNYEANLADDGILTAVEVSALDLGSTDLVVLSACETGLGRTAGGEGVLGLQRAFQLAGAKTGITSLWKVDDAATQQLMQEFYTNLWQKKLGKLEALRQAQLAMIRRYDPQRKKLRARGLDVAETQRAFQQGAPFYWAAFMLSGDWR